LNRQYCVGREMTSWEVQGRSRRRHRVTEDIGGVGGSRTSAYTTGHDALLARKGKEVDIAEINYRTDS